MRHSPIYALLLVASCAPPGEENKAAGGADAVGPSAVVTALSKGGADCSIRWNGEAIPHEEILDNSIKLIMRTIEDVGGIEKITEENMAYLRLEAASDVPYSCTGSVLRDIRRAGFAHVLLRLVGPPAPDQRLDFPLEADSTGGKAVIRLEKGGRMSWDGAPLEKGGLAERARAAAAMAPPPDLVLAPSADSDFVVLHDAVGTIRRERLSPLLMECAGNAGATPETYLC